MLKAISNLECSEEFNQRNFAPVEYKDAKGEMRPAYRITRDGFAFLAMGFTGKKAAAWKEKFLEAFNAMEAELTRRQASKLEEKELEEEQPAEIPAAVPCKFFYPRKKASKRQIEDMAALLRLEAVIQRDDVLTATDRLCRRMGVSSIADIPSTRVIPALHAIFSNMYEMRAQKEPKAADADFLRETLHGLIAFWHRAAPEYRENEIRTYVCNKCNVDTVENLETEHDLFLGIVALWCGVNNHVFQTKSW